jgi:hypothetical protein
MPVNDIPEPDRRSLENLLGHPLATDEQVCVIVYSAGKSIDAATRRSAANNIRQTLERVDQHRNAQAVSDDATEAAIDEAMERIRPRAN